ncbi:MAG: glutamate--tRNA ligase [Chloroflexi bacterium]|nr:glutamate--tRNA ligase [Chloroflexota bacterium]
MTASSSRPVRVRFAPSPTGSLHIGGLRTALYNWLFARRHGGTFILRIEDTDQKRYDPDALRILMEAPRRAGLDWDEGPEVEGDYGPYVQSERLPLYQEWANWLVEQGQAYPAYETPAELEQARKEQQARGEQPGYNRAHRDLTPEQRAAFEAEGRSKVIRLKMPLEGQIHVKDAIQGDVSFDYSVLQDTVLLKADGFPTYHLAHVVDDHFMEISHVMRAVEWLSSLPVHWQLWLAFGWEIPVYAHVPVMLNPNGKGKMSKRDKSQRTLVHEYIAAGYLSEALVNYLLNSSWYFGDEQEVYSLPAAIERFAPDGINPTNAAFQPDKLDWYNGVYIRQLDPMELAKRLRPVLEDAGYEVNIDMLLALAPLLQPRLKRLSAEEVMAYAGFLFRDEFPALPRETILKGYKGDVATAQAALRAAHGALAALAEFSAAEIEAALRTTAESLGMKPKEFFSLLRNALTGQEVTPPLFDTLPLIGRDTALGRLEAAANTLTG